MIDPVAQLSRALAAPDAETRRRALAELPTPAPAAALPAVLEALGDPDWRVRKEASLRLAAWPDGAAAATALVATLRDHGNVGRRNAAVDTLGRLGPVAVGPVLSSLPPEGGGQGGGFPKLLIDALAAIADPAAVPRLTECLSSDDSNIRVAAAEALRAIGGPAAAAALRTCLPTADRDLRLAALEGLAALSTRVPRRELAPFLDDPLLREAALLALGGCADPEAAPALVAALAEPRRALREAAVRALARLLMSTAHPERSGREAAAESRGPLAALEPGARAQLRAMLTAGGAEVRRAAATVIGACGQPDDAALLTAQLDDPDVGAACAAALAALRPHTRAPTPPPLGRARVDMSEAEFAELRQLIHGYSGIAFEPGKKYLLERRLAARLEAAGARDFAEYARLLRSGSRGRRELEEAVDRVAINETYFFREDYQLRAFSDEILPAIRAAGRKRLSIWSAGCSTGEEAYTISMLVLEDGGFAGWDVRIVGSDISRRALRTASLGRYREGAFRATTPARRDRFFRRVDDEWEVRDPVRAPVSFARLNLLEHEPLAEVGEVDVLFCRNVLIYFDSATRERVVRAFWQQLAPGGWLLLGHSETLLTMSTAFELVQLRNDTVYRKPVAA
jgi:chemotaxis protein methyltransferase CheR